MMNTKRMVWLIVGSLWAQSPDALFVSLNQPKEPPTKISTPDLRSIILDIKVNEVIETVGASSKVWFRENKGQVRDQNYNPRWDVLFTAEYSGMVLHVTTTGFLYQLLRETEEEEEEEYSSEDPQEVEEEEKLTIEIYRVDVEFLGGQVRGVEALGQKTWYENFYNTPNGVNPVLNVRSYGKVRLREVWPGVDVVFYGQDGVIKYDFEVKPGTDISTIRLRVSGAEMHVSNDELIMTTPFGQIREGAPKAWANYRPIRCTRILSGDVISFSAPERRLDEPLRIDPPVRLWGTFYLGSSHDEPGHIGHSMAVHGSVVYIAGATPSTSLVATTGAHQTVISSSNHDAYLAQFSDAGQLNWGTYYGGSSQDKGHGCTVDASGNVYLVGETFSNSGISTSGAYRTTLGGSLDAFLVKFNSSGVRLWGTYYGGSGNDRGFACAVHGNSVYISGDTESNNTAPTYPIASPGAHQHTRPGNRDLFLAKLSDNGTTRNWGTYYGGSGFDEGGLVTVDPSGDVYLAGRAYSTESSLTTSGVHQTANIGGSADVIVAKFNPSGVRIWATFYGGDHLEELRRCIVDNSGNLYLVGATLSTNGIASPGAHQTTKSATWDGFLAKFNANNGTRHWGTYYGGGMLDNLSGCAVDGSGNIFVAGMTASGSDISTSGTHQPNHAGGSGLVPVDAFLVKFNSSGTRIWATYYGGDDNDYATACALHPYLPIIYMWGGTYTLSTPSGLATSCTSGYLQHRSTNAGSEDAFLVAFADGDMPTFQPCLPPLAYHQPEPPQTEPSVNSDRTWDITLTNTGIELFASEPVKLEMLDMQGKLLYTWALSKGERRHEALSYPSGMYIIRESEGDKVVRLILQP
ncbi:MAG: hypothetical protein RML92_09135 [Bacteroidia bacterium]|nr:hypothetical protein [Bacteroidia bacterium]